MSEPNQPRSSSGQLASNRETRYQGAIVRDHYILLLYGRKDWGEAILKNPITYDQLVEIRHQLGYPSE